MTLAHDALILVADGRKFILFRNAGDAIQINLTTEAHDEQPDLKDREWHTDGPGTQGQRFGDARPAMEETDFHQQSEDDFARKISERLNRMALDGAFSALAVIAPARTMGALRQNWHTETERRIVREITKEMVDRPTADIEALLAGNPRPPG